MVLHKYDIAKEYHFLAMIGITIYDDKTIRLSNELLSKINLLHADRDIDSQKISIPSFDGNFIDIYTYRPKSLSHEKDLPCIVYFHGGGFFLKGDVLSTKIVSEYARYTEAVIVYVDYRLSLDNPYPTPLNDCYSALEWVSENYRFLGINSNNIGVIGFSAGGALAAGVTLMARDKKGPEIKAQGLMSPVTDHRQITASVKEFTDTPNWNSQSNRHMWELYLRELISDNIPCYASPATATSFKNLPPAYIEVSQFDPLHDEGLNYGHSLGQAGVETLINDTKGTIHVSSTHLKSETTKKNMRIMLDYIKGYISE